MVLVAIVVVALAYRIIIIKILKIFSFFVITHINNFDTELYRDVRKGWGMGGALVEWVNREVR